jgi:transcriptional regulator with XRE-family HTH domain
VSKKLPRFAVALTCLRVALGWSQGELAAALGISSNLISDYERGHKPLSRERLEQLAATLGLPRDAVDDVLAWVDKVWVKAGTAVYPGAPGEAQAERWRLEAVVQALARATSEAGRPLFALLSVEMRALAERQGVKGSWARLLRRPPAERRALVRKSRELRSWALCELVCAESVKAAPHSAELALEHAGLAVEIARVATCEDLFRRRLQGYAEAHLANAHRVHGNLRIADETFGRARALWKAGAPGDPGLLNEARVLGMEASLRNLQQQIGAALDLLDQALAVDRNGEARFLLIVRALVLENAGEFEESIAALRRAAPLIDGREEPRSLFCLRFNLLGNLCHLRRFDEAQELLLDVRASAERLGQDLDLLRTLWLEGRVATGLGHRKEAIAILKHVSLEFAKRNISHDAALASMEVNALNNLTDREHIP